MLRGFLLWLALIAPAFAADDKPAVLVTDVLSSTDSGIEPFTELPGNVDITLGSSDEIEFVHYGTCTRYRLRGGKITLTIDAVETEGSEILGKSIEDCPRQVAVGGDETAGVVFRSKGDAFLVPLPIRLVIAGPGFEKASAVVVMRGDQRIGEKAVTGRDIPFDAVDDAVLPGHSYELILLDDAGASIGQAKITPRVGSGIEGLIVVRID